MTASLTIATDGSTSQSRRGGHSGWAWVSSTGVYSSGNAATGSILLAELTAIEAALRWALRGPGRSRHVVILTDSQPARHLIEKLRQHAVITMPAGTAGHREIARTARHIAELIRSNPSSTITLTWVRGHNGHPLNEAADRIARQSRISGAMPSAAQAALYAQIAHDATRTWHHAA